jgi:phage-related protein
MADTPPAPKPRKPLRVLSGEIKTPPFTSAGRIEAGTLLRRLQEGESLGLPHSRPLPTVGARVHELRVRDAAHNWRIIYRIDPNVILVIDVFEKKTPKIPKEVIAACKKRLKSYDAG